MYRFVAPGKTVRYRPYTQEIKLRHRKTDGER
jgi:hypothetical protein